MNNKRSTLMLSRLFGASCDYAMVHLAIFAVLVTAHQHASISTVITLISFNEFTEVKLLT